jgi:predicted kinase
MSTVGRHARFAASLLQWRVDVRGMGSRLARVGIPTLVVVSGPPGTGKTRLAHALARAIPCPAICRDEIKEGMAHAHAGDFAPEEGDPLTLRTLTTFFDTVELLVSAGVSVVAEAAFQDHRWRPALEPLSEVAELRIVRCTVDPTLAWERANERQQVEQRSRAAHVAGERLRDLELWNRNFAAFDHLAMAAPSIVVDTSNVYEPALDEIVAFVNAR